MALRERELQVSLSVAVCSIGNHSLIMLSLLEYLNEMKPT